MLKLNSSKILKSLSFCSVLFTACFISVQTSFASQLVLKATDNVNFREEPSKDSNKIALVFAGEEVEVISEEDGWSNVEIDGNVGYIKSEFLSDIEDNEQNTVELTTWNEAKNIFTIGQAAKIYDIYSGKVYYVKSFSNGKHADVETVTKEDTAIFKSTYGGSWSWDPRPILVTINGKTMAASINGMPHGGGVNSDNGMNGQVCIHFKGSSTHNGNSSFTRWHQDVLMDAYNSSN